MNKKNTTTPSHSPCDHSSDNLGQQLLQYYQAIEQASQDMLEAARAGDWDAVVRLEGACAVLIAQLKEISDQHCLAPEQIQEKTRILQKILRNDAQIRNMTDPWAMDLSHALSGSSPRSRLH